MKTLIVFVEEFDTEFECLLAMSQQENAYFRHWIIRHNPEHSTYSVFEKVID